MLFFKQFSGVLLYLFSVLSLLFIAVMIKIISLSIADQLIYNLYIVGDILRGLEIVETVNILVFAILGMGFGLISIYLPKRWGIKIGALFLIILFPLIFTITNLVRYHTWIQHIVANQGISYVRAENFSNNFLKNKIGTEGFIGFYLYTASFPALPTKESQIQEIEELQKSVKNKILQIILHGNKIQLSTATGILAIGSWGIRVFYFLLSLLATVVHFWEGLKEAGRIPIIKEEKVPQKVPQKIPKKKLAISD